MSASSGDCRYHNVHGSCQFSRARLEKDAPLWLRCNYIKGEHCRDPQIEALPDGRRVVIGGHS